MVWGTGRWWSGTVAGRDRIMQIRRCGAELSGVAGVLEPGMIRAAP